MNAEELKKIVVPGDEIRRKCWKDSINMLFVNENGNFTRDLDLDLDLDLDIGKYLIGDDWEVVKVHYIKEAFNANVLGGKYYHDCEKAEATHILKPFNKG